MSQETTVVLSILPRDQITCIYICMYARFFAFHTLFFFRKQTKYDADLFNCHIDFRTTAQFDQC